jgi:hypothetical protein
MQKNQEQTRSFVAKPISRNQKNYIKEQHMADRVDLQQALHWKPRLDTERISCGLRHCDEYE